MCYALGPLSASVSTMYSVLQSPVTAIIAWLWQGQTVGLLLGAGGLLGMTGLMLTSVFSDETPRTKWAFKRVCARTSTIATAHALKNPLLNQ